MNFNESHKFTEFVNHKEREGRKHLGILKKVFEHHSFHIADKLDHAHDPYFFVYNPSNNLSFDGVRIYEIGGEIAYRVQKEAETHPYGKAYLIPVEEMFDDFLSEDNLKEEEIGRRIMESIIKELKNFFEVSYRAEQDGPALKDDPLGKVYMRSTGTDYANTVTDKQG